MDAEKMAEDIDEKGSVSIYGIHFHTDKATIKEESESTLAEIAALMKEEPDLSLGVVGHTDAVGSIVLNTIWTCPCAVQRMWWNLLNTNINKGLPRLSKGD